MSTLLLTFTALSFIGELEALRARAMAEPGTRAVPLPFAVAPLTVISGNDQEVGGYRSLSGYETAWAWNSFRTAVTGVAKQLLRAHPEVADEVLAHDLVKKHLTKGPFKRLPRDLQAAKALSGLLADAWVFIEYQKRGLFDWDDGDAQGSMAIVYLWRKVVKGKRGIFQSVNQLHNDGRKILTAARAARPQNPRLQIIDHRAKLAWFSLTPNQRAASLAALEDLSRQLGQTEDATAIRLLALSSLFDASLRFREPNRALIALAEIQSIVVPNQPDHPQIRLGRAWAKALGGEATTARFEALQAADKGDEVMRSRAAQVLRVIGDTQTAGNILNSLSPDFHPREKRLEPVLTI